MMWNGINVECKNEMCQNVEGCNEYYMKITVFYHMSWSYCKNNILEINAYITVYSEYYFYGQLKIRIASCDSDIVTKGTSATICTC